MVNQPEDPEAKRKELINQAVVLLNNGVDPKIVGQILSGSTQIPVPVAAAPGADGGAMGILKTLVDSLLVNQKSAEVEAVRVQMKALEDKIAATAKGGADHDRPPPAPPPTPEQVIQAATGLVKGLYGSFEQMGLIQSGATAGQSIEHLKEEHRHKEEMEKLGADREHKQSLAEIAGEIPERFGEGYARHLEQAGAAGAAAGEGGDAGGLRTFRCVNDKCGAPVVVTPESGDIVFCGKCGQAHKKVKEEKGAQGNA